MLDRSFRLPAQTNISYVVLKEGREMRSFPTDPGTTVTCILERMRRPASGPSPQQ